MPDDLISESDTAPDRQETEGYVEITVEIPKEFEEYLTDFLIDNVAGGNGLVIEDRENDTLIRFYIPAAGNIQAETGKIRDLLLRSSEIDPETVTDRVSHKRIQEIDWVSEYRRKFEPVVIGDVVIKSAWTEEQFPGKLEISLEPKMAFGTGKHETTQLCIEALGPVVNHGDFVLDLGTGSGILAILAAKLGAAEVLGLDLDSAAVENARENIALNSVEDRIVVEYGSMQKVRKQHYYDIVVSNLIRDGIFELFDDFVRVAKPRGLMILSGILENQVEEMNRFFERKHHPDFRITTKGEWICYTMRV